MEEKNDPEKLSRLSFHPKAGSVQRDSYVIWL